MRVLLQYIIYCYVIELGTYSGMLFGIRHFEPNEYYNDYQIQLYIPFIYLAIVKKLEDD